MNDFAGSLTPSLMLRITGFSPDSITEIPHL
jgi:hypothetical protein